MAGQWAHAGICRNTAVGLSILLLSGAAGGKVAAQCAPFPEVSWWGSLTHELVSKYVSTRYDGNWKPYIATWQRKLEKLRDIRKRDLAAAITVGTDNKRKKILRSVELDKYIESVEQRLSIMHCLANEAEKATPQTKVARSAPGTGGLTTEVVAAGKEKAATLGCLKCHGTSLPPGKQAMPDLAGQNEFYLIRQLKEFQSQPTERGEPFGAVSRHSRIMKFRAGALTENDIWNLSAYFTSLSRCPEGKGKSVPPPAPAIADKCIRCHGPEGKSAQPEVPNLAGQTKGYLLRELYAFRRSANGKSKGKMIDSRYHYFTSALIRTLSDADMERLADYYSKLGCGQ